MRAGSRLGDLFGWAYMRAAPARPHSTQRGYQMPAIRKSTPQDFIEGYPPLDHATRAMLARRANLGPGTTVAALRARQKAYDAAHPGDLDEPAPYSPTIHIVSHDSPDGGRILTHCPSAPHDPSLLALQGTFMDSDEFGESVAQYIAGNVNHPLVSKFGWGKDSKLRAS